MYEVFDPRNGQTIYTVKSQWLAAALARLFKLDYALEGEGW